MTNDLNDRERMALAMILHRSSISRRDLIVALLDAAGPEVRRELHETFVAREAQVQAPTKETSLPDYKWETRFFREGDIIGVETGWYWVEVMTVEAFGDSEGPYDSWLAAQATPPLKD